MNKFEQIDILELLPQQPPFVMIDKLLWFDEIFTRTRLTVNEGNIFCENGTLSSSGLIENIAQTCAARMGYINKFMVNDSVKLGFIGAIRDLLVLRRPNIGETIETEIEVVEDVMRMTLVKATVKSADETIVTAEMKIALSEINKAV